MLFQLNPSSSMIINRARLTSAAGETRDRVNDTNARRSSLVRLKTDSMLHIVLLKSMLHNTSANCILGGGMLRIDPGVKARRADRLESHSQRQCCIGEKSFPEEALRHYGIPNHSSHRRAR